MTKRIILYFKKSQKEQDIEDIDGHEDDVINNLIMLEHNDLRYCSIYKLLHGKTPYSYKCLVKSGDFVFKDQVLISGHKSEVSELDLFEIISPKEGCIELIFDSTWRVDWSEHNLFAIFKDNIERQKALFTNEIAIIEDEFTKEKRLYFKRIGSPSNKLLEFLPKLKLGFEDFKINSDYGLSLENISGYDYLIIKYDIKKINLSESDLILFLFENDELLTFEIKGKPVIIYRNFMKAYKIPLYIEDINILKSNVVKKIRIVFIQDNYNIDVSINEDKQFILQNLFIEYRMEVEQKILDYKPLSNTEIISEVINEKNDSCYVYIMIDSTNGFYKIGISNKPNYRERTLQSEKPTIDLVSQKKYPTRKIAESIEKALHNTFSKNNIRGEWFNLTSEDVINIIETLK